MDYAKLARAIFAIVEDKTRRFVYNDNGVYELTYNSWDVITWNHVQRVIGEHPEIKHGETPHKFIEGCLFGHDVVDKGGNVSLRKGLHIFNYQIAAE